MCLAVRASPNPTFTPATTISSRSPCGARAVLTARYTTEAAMIPMTTARASTTTNLRLSTASLLASLEPHHRLASEGKWTLQPGEHDWEESGEVYGHVRGDRGIGGAGARTGDGARCGRE